MGESPMNPPEWLADAGVKAFSVPEHVGKAKVREGRLLGECPGSHDCPPACNCGDHRCDGECITLTAPWREAWDRLKEKYREDRQPRAQIPGGEGVVPDQIMYLVKREEECLGFPPGQEGKHSTKCHCMGTGTVTHHELVGEEDDELTDTPTVQGLLSDVLRNYGPEGVLEDLWSDTEEPWASMTALLFKHSDGRRWGVSR